jgi:hypothetical protein
MASTSNFIRRESNSKFGGRAPEQMVLVQGRDPNPLE